jgi:hypothetical protein
MKFKITLLIAIILFQLTSFAQENSGPTSIKSASSMTIVPSLASRTNLALAPISNGEAKDKKSGKNTVVFGKGLPLGKDALLNTNENAAKIQGRTPSIVFDAAASNSQPTDPDVAVGPNHCVVVFNTGFRIFDKLGNPLTAQLNTSTIFPSSGCCDLTCSYDTQAQRFVMTFLGGGVQVAVSQTSDPLNGGWYVYNFPMNTDYQKLSIWSDGYYLAANKDSGSADTSEVVYALERSKMLIGDINAQIIGFPLPGIVTSGFYSPQVFNATSVNFPAPGNVPIVYLQDDAWAGVTQDHLKLWTINVNWNVPANSTISTGQTLVTTPFTSVFDNGSFVNLPQPSGGPLIDALQAIIMNQAQFRKFPSHNSAVFNFVIDTDAGATKLAAIRWYELRQNADGQPWSIFQEGTYSSPLGKHAWHASMGIDVQGNIGMGYTAMGGTNNQILGSYYTGRYTNDPLGTMTIQENVIALGNANIPGTRYGDYSKVAIDPVDDKSFWFIDEYMNSGRKDVVGVFKIAPDFTNDVGVVAITNPNNGTLTNTESITISVFNYGQATASNFPVSYQIDGGPIITETFTGSIASAGNGTFTFTTTANLATVGQVYSITAFTSLVNDEDNSNNPFTKSVTHLFPNDVGVTAIISPVSGTNLTATENIVITIENFGGQPQSNFPIAYTLDGTTVNATYTGTLAPTTSANYTFAQTGNLAAFGNHTLSSTTNLIGDSNIPNNTFSTIINKTNCQPNIDCSDGDGFTLFQLGTINNASNCGTNGYSDFTTLSTDLVQQSSNSLTMTTGYGNQNVTVWIDFNDDFVFTTNEKVVNNYILGAGQGAGSFTGTTTVLIANNAPLGEHLMRAKSNWNNPVPDDACQETTYGETEDYTVNITAPLGIGEFNSNTSQFNIISSDNSIFQLSLEQSQYTKPLELTVYNTLGQRVVYHKVRNVNGNYNYELDMSYAPSGVYLVRLGDKQFGKVKKILVK